MNLELAKIAKLLGHSQNSARGFGSAVNLCAIEKQEIGSSERDDNDGGYYRKVL